MENQKLQSSALIQTGRPPKWEEMYLIKRIENSDILINLIERNAILQALNGGQKYIQIGKYTLMLNGIRGIDPMWGPKNIPPRPRPDTKTEYKEKYNIHTDTKEVEVIETITNQEEIDEWDKYFKDK